MGPEWQVDALVGVDEDVADGSADEDSPDDILGDIKDEISGIGADADLTGEIELTSDVNI